MARKINNNNHTGNLTRRPVGLDQTRRKHSDPEAFLNGAEKHDIDTAEETRKLNTKARAELRADGKNSNLYALRGTTQQQQIIQYAAKEEDVSIQKLLASLIFPVLEEKYGQDLPLNNL
jgi:mucin-2